MNIITLDGKTYPVKYKQNSEVVSTDFGTGLYNFPDFVGSKLYHNSTSSDKYSLTFAVHKTNLVAFKRSINRVVISERDAVQHPVYGRLTHLVIEHNIWGAILGNILGSIVYETGSEGDVLCKCTFAEHTPDTLITETDLQDEDKKALDNINTQTTDNFDVQLSTQDLSALSGLADRLEALYSNVQNSAVVSAFNGLIAEIHATVIDSTRIMNVFKDVLALPGSITSDFRRQLELYKSQAEAIKLTAVSSYNLALFNANALSYNMGLSTQTPFISESAAAAAAGIKTVPLS